jgi:hypothetical protein
MNHVDTALQSYYPIALSCQLQPLSLQDVKVNRQYCGLPVQI